MRVARKRRGQRPPNSEQATVSISMQGFFSFGWESSSFKDFRANQFQQKSPGRFTEQGFAIKPGSRVITAPAEELLLLGFLLVFLHFVFLCRRCRRCRRSRRSGGRCGGCVRASECWGANGGDDGKYQCGNQFVHGSIPIKTGWDERLEHKPNQEHKANCF
jgi:hypothetical protein